MKDGVKGRGREGNEYAAEHALLVCGKRPAYNWSQSGCKDTSVMGSVQFALLRLLFHVGLVFVVNNHLNDAGREMKAAPQAACAASWRLSCSEKRGALVVGTSDESFKLNDLMKLF